MNICYISLGLYQGMEWLGHIVSVYLIFERSWQFFLQWLCHFTYSSTVYESSCSWRSSQTLGILSRKNCDVLHRTQNFPIVSKNLSKPHSVQFSSVAQLCLTLCNAMDTHRPPCPSPTPRVYPNSCPSSQWCHPTISSSVIPFPSCPQSFPASFPMSQLFASGGQSIGVSVSASVLPMKTQDWSPLGWTGWISLQSTFSSIQFSCSVVSDFLRPHESQHAIPPCSSPTPGAYSNSCPSSRWCHPAISSSVIFFSSCCQRPSIRVFSNELFLCIRWPKYWSFSISPSNEYLGLISLRIDWFDLLAVQESSPKPQFKSINFLEFSFPYSSTLKSIHNYRKIEESRENH